MKLGDTPVSLSRRDTLAIAAQAIRRTWATPILRRAIRVVWAGLIVFFVGYYIWRNWAVFCSYDWELDWRWLLVALVWAMGRRLLGGIRWCLIIFYNQKRWTRRDILDHLGVYFLSNLARYIPGSFWYVAGRVGLGKDKGVSTLRTSMGSVYEMGLNVWTGCLVGACVATTLFLPNDLTFVVLVALLIVLSLLMIHPKVVNPLLRYTLRVIKRPSTRVGLTFGWMLQLWLISMAVWIVGGLSQFCLLRALYPSLSLEHLAGITSSTALAWTIGFLVPWAPQGLGVRDGLLVWMLGAYVPTPLAVIAAVASRLITVFEDLAWSLIAITVSRR